MRSCRRLNARATLFSGLSRNRGGRGKKKRKKRGWKKCIRRYPDYSIHGQSPAFRQPRSRDEKAILEGISSVYRLFSRFFLPSFSLQLAWRKGQLSDSLFPFSLSLPSFHVSREKLSKFIDCSRWRLISNFVQIILFFFVKSLRNLRKDSSNRSSILRIFGYRNITKIFSDFQSRKFVEKCFFYGIVKGWIPNRAIQ